MVLSHYATRMDPGVTLPPFESRSLAERRFFERARAEVGEAVEGLAEYPEVASHALLVRWALAALCADAEAEPTAWAEAYADVPEAERDTALEFGIALLGSFELWERFDEQCAALQARREDARTSLLLANGAFRRQRFEAARDHYQRALDRAEGETAIVARLGLGIALLRDPATRAEARGHLGQTVELAPDSALAHFAYAVSCAEAGDLELAKKHIRRAEDLEPAYPPIIETALELEFG